MGIERVMHNMIHMRLAVFLITCVPTPSEAEAVFHVSLDPTMEN